MIPASFKITSNELKLFKKYCKVANRHYQRSIFKKTCSYLIEKKKLEKEKHKVRFYSPTPTVTR